MDIMEPVKFLYAADLRLDSTVALGEGSGVLVPRARDVAYEATRRLVDCALSRGVDFVLLKGELFDAHCGAKALLFLIEQTTRLSNAGIVSYILNERLPLDVRWLAEFPASVKWLERKEASIVCGARELPLISLLEPAPLPLQGLGSDENGPRGAWLVSLPDDGEPLREFIELNALRFEHCEMDVTSIETEDDLAASWRAVKGGFRERESMRDRPVLLHLKLTGVMKERFLFYGENFMRDSGALMKKLNADESARKNFVLVDSLEDDTISQARQPLSSIDTRETGEKGANSLESDFWGEMAFFKSGIDLLVGLFDALKERGVLKHILATDAAPLLENITEADVGSLLKETCDMATYELFRNARDPK